jgi:type IV secretion system protein VirB4
VTVLSGRESTVRKLDALRADVGDDPSAWYEPLTGEAWPGGDAYPVQIEAAE